jgi:hypothetical protein
MEAANVTRERVFRVLLLPDGTRTEVRYTGTRVERRL